METYLYEFDKNILEEMYMYASEREMFYIKNNLNIEFHHRCILGHRIIISNCERDPNDAKIFFLEWLKDNHYRINDLFIFLNDNPPRFIFEILRHLKKLVDDIPNNETIESYGLNANSIRYFFSTFEYNDTPEVITEKLGSVEDLNIISNKELFNLSQLFDTIWPYVMPYLYLKPIKECDTNEMLDFCLLVQISIDLVKKYKKQYYSWTSFYNFDYDEITKGDNNWTVLHFKNKQYSLVHECFNLYFEYIENMTKTYECFHEKLVDKHFGRYARKAIIENIYTRSFYTGYRLFCKKNSIIPNFLLDYNLNIDDSENIEEESPQIEDIREGVEIIEEDTDSVQEEDKITHLPQLPHFTKPKLIELLKKFRDRKEPFVHKETKQKNWLFVFGMKGDTPPEGFEKIKWEAKYNGRPAKGALIDFLELLGYDIDQLYDENSIEILNECFECYNKKNEKSPIGYNDFHYNKRTKERDHSKTFYEHFERIIENIEKEA